MPVIVELEVAGVAGGAVQGSGRVTVRNETAQQITFRPVQLESPSLAYEVVDAAGRPVPLPPPPVPDPGADPATVDARESWATEHPAILPDETQPGRYRVRARVFLLGVPEPIYSDWSDLEI